MPTIKQLEVFYRVSHQLTFEMSQPIYLVWLDKPTQNLYLLAGYNYEIEFEITPSVGLS